MDILIIIDSLGAGGAERSTAVFCEYLESKNLHFKILCLDEKDVGFQQDMLAQGYSIQFLKKNGFLSQVKQIKKIIRAGNFDIVHSILFRANLRTRLAKMTSDFVHLESLVNTTYSSERFADEKVNKRGLRLYKFLDKITAKKGVDHFHSITEAVKGHYVEEIGLDPEKITVVPRGRKPILQDYKDKPINLSSKVQLINVGRHEFQKGQIYLLEAVKTLRKEGFNFHLKILGRSGTATAELERYVRDHELEEIVTLKGFKSNVPDYLVEADLFIFPSLYEGLGGALIEAQSAGLPIACNDIPVLHEVVEKDRNAKFFNVHNQESIVGAIRFFLENPEVREEYGKESLKNFKNKFLESKNNQKLLNLYQKLA